MVDCSYKYNYFSGALLITASNFCNLCYLHIITEHQYLVLNVSKVVLTYEVVLYTRALLD